MENYFILYIFPYFFNSNQKKIKKIFYFFNMKEPLIKKSQQIEISVNLNNKRKNQNDEGRDRGFT